LNKPEKKTSTERLFMVALGWFVVMLVGWPFWFYNPDLLLVWVLGSLFAEFLGWPAIQLFLVKCWPDKEKKQ
jgi:hypothetical protein